MDIKNKEQIVEDFKKLFFDIYNKNKEISILDYQFKNLKILKNEFLNNIKSVIGWSCFFSLFLIKGKIPLILLLIYLFYPKKSVYDQKEKKKIFNNLNFSKLNILFQDGDSLIKVNKIKSFIYYFKIKKDKDKIINQKTKKINYFLKDLEKIQKTVSIEKYVEILKEINSQNLLSIIENKNEFFEETIKELKSYYILYENYEEFNRNRINIDLVNQEILNQSLKIKNIVNY